MKVERGSAVALCRQRVFEIIEKSSGEDIVSTAYDYLMIVAIVIGIVPLAFKQSIPFL